MNVTKSEVETYLEEVKSAVRNNRYRIEMNDFRQDNNNLFYKYVIGEAKVKNILLDLTSTDFSEIKHNSHIGYGHELLYVFGKDVLLLERFGHSVETVSLYIKLNKIADCFVIVVSFHEQKYPISYKFK